MTRMLNQLCDRYRQGDFKVIDEIIEVANQVTVDRALFYQVYQLVDEPKAIQHLLPAIANRPDIHREGIEKVCQKFYGNTPDYDADLSDYAMRTTTFLAVMEDYESKNSMSTSARVIYQIALQRLPLMRMNLEGKIFEATQNTDNVYVASLVMKAYDGLVNSSFESLKFSPETKDAFMLFKLRHGPDIRDLEDRIDSFIAN